ncbi:uncharacterized protein N7446_007823 [Penicillium canescens]|uniref:uncharacterized protein n=1 Tax=Penicillium canescens TaxID=5083 RepID=UPI0026DEF316|nr:uncharacterized protein N7446_007823 [Penicillium canescens]KAJ6033880.1 hypothetical protein N7444_011651 [Penicillium canescens]KAJ6058240.1 hypothetical protein N7446_007823 [Penicillium canescens]
MPQLSEGIYARSVAPSSRAVELIIVSSIFTALAILFCGMRLYTRRVLLKTVGVDDWIVTIATILSFLQSIVNTLATRYGLGYRDNAFPPSYSPTSIGKIQYTFYAINLSTLGLCRISMLVTYLKLNIAWSRRFAQGLIGFNVLLSLAALGISLFRCRPMHNAWDLTKENAAGCMPNFSGFQIGLLASNAVQEVIIIVLPIPVIWSIHRLKAQRIVIILLFSCGIFTLAASVARLIVAILANDVEVNYLRESLQAPHLSYGSHTN